MKTQNNILTKITNLSILVILLILGILASCNTKEGDKGSSNSSDIKAPEVDIHTAVLTDNKAALQQHIAVGSNLNEKDPYGGSSPLITASLFDKREMAEILIAAGADLNFQNNDGATALHVASFFCRPEIVKMLLDKGADKTIKNKFGATPYESMTPPFSEVKNVYDMMGKMLGPMGLKLDYAYVEKTRPEIAAMLETKN